MRKILLAVWLAAAVACDSGPGPTPIPPPPPPPPLNNAPVIEGIAASATRIEAEAEVTLTATVRDAETPVDQLQLAWSAEGGTFSGTGATVRWRAPRTPETPLTYTITLTVTEVYGTAPPGGARPEHKVTGTSPAIRVHDSSREIGDMSMRFLAAFGNSDVPADEVVREFTDSCPGKAAEREDVANNRVHYRILEYTLILRNSSVSNPSRGTARVACDFLSRILKCEPHIPNCVVGSIGRVRGDCDLTAVYERERWWLCDSNFNNSENLPAGFGGFFGRR